MHQKRLQELNKTYYRSLRLLFNKTEDKKTWDIIGRYAPKEFFYIINLITKFKSKGQLMIAFKSKIVNDEVVKEESLHQYMTKLYDTKYKDSVNQYIVRSNNSKGLTLNDLQWA